MSQHALHTWLSQDLSAFVTRHLISTQTTISAGLALMLIRFVLLAVMTQPILKEIVTLVQEGNLLQLMDELVSLIVMLLTTLTVQLARLPLVPLAILLHKLVLLTLLPPQLGAEP